jgi:hypothetical protein
MTRGGHSTKQRGAAGAPITDRRGMVVGLVANNAKEARQVAGTVPATPYDIVPAGVLSDFLGEAGIRTHKGPSSGLKTAGEILSKLGSAIVAVDYDR